MGRRARDPGRDRRRRARRRSPDPRGAMRRSQGRGAAVRQLVGYRIDRVTTRIALIVLALGVAAAAVVLLVAIRSGDDPPPGPGSVARGSAPTPDATPAREAPHAEPTDP